MIPTYLIIQIICELNGITAKDFKLGKRGYNTRTRAASCKSFIACALRDIRNMSAHQINQATGISYWTITDSWRRLDREDNKLFVSQYNELKMFIRSIGEVDGREIILNKAI